MSPKNWDKEVIMQIKHFDSWEPQTAFYGSDTAEKKYCFGKTAHVPKHQIMTRMTRGDKASSFIQNVPFKTQP
jgi:hypothetical protein